MKDAIKFLFSLVYVVLIVAGLAGLSFDLFRPDGWVSHWLGNIWDAETSLIVMGIPVVVGAFIVGKNLFGGLLASSSGDKLVQAMMILLMLWGVYYIIKFVV